MRSIKGREGERKQKNRTGGQLERKGGERKRTKMKVYEEEERI